MHYIVGLGNPGEEYENTRHNVGRMAVEMVAQEFAANGAGSVKGSKGGKSTGGTGGISRFFKMDKVLKAQKAKVEIGGGSATLLLPETFMNKSGASVAPLLAPAAKSGNSGGKAISATEKKAHEKKTRKLVVIHDDLDLPFGQMKIVYNRGSGGHKGVESIVRAIKTEAFVRIKIGVVPTTPGGKLRKPKGGEKGEMPELKKILKQIPEIVSVIVNEGEGEAMNRFN
jgi:PTH1 family peptidyl-tRNA hydrolase